MFEEDEDSETPSERAFDYARTVALSDGVFAIALTLLVLTLTLPELQGAAKHQLANRLSDQSAQLYSYALSFAVLGLLWVRHHTMFRNVTRIDARVTVLNLAYLAVVAFLPFPTRLMGSYGDQPVAVVVYATTITLIVTLGMMMRVYADRAGLMAPGAPREALSRYVVTISVFLVSIPMALLVDASAGIWTWTAVPVANLSGLWRRPKSGPA